MKNLAVILAAITTLVLLTLVNSLIGGDGFNYTIAGAILILTLESVYSFLISKLTKKLSKQKSG